jgi:hypothetical protein
MTKEIIHSFKGFGRVPSHCVVRIFSDDGENLICFIDTNDGTSVTNASEQLASEIVNKCGFNPDECQFFETYSQYNYEDFDEIEYTWTKKSDGKWEARLPQWKPCSQEIKKLFIKI